MSNKPIDASATVNEGRSAWLDPPTCKGVAPIAVDACPSGVCGVWRPLGLEASSPDCATGVKAPGLKACAVEQGNGEPAAGLGAWDAGLGAWGAGLGECNGLLSCGDAC